MADRAPYCANCGEVAEQPFCGACGQRQGDYESGLLGLLRSFVSETLEIDRRIGRTLHRLFLDPGRVTAEYVQDRRRHYTHPVKLLLFSTMLLVATLSLTGRLEGGVQVETGFGQPVLDVAIADEAGLSESATAALRSAYHEQLLAALPWLLSIPLPATIVGLALASSFLRVRRPAITHVVLVMHESSVALVLIAGFVVVDPPVWGWFAVGLLGAHGSFAIRRAYDLGWAGACGMGSIALIVMIGFATATAKTVALTMGSGT